MFEFNRATVEIKESADAIFKSLNLDSEPALLKSRSENLDAQRDSKPTNEKKKEKLYEIFDLSEFAAQQL